MVQLLIVFAMNFGSRNSSNGNATNLVVNDKISTIFSSTRNGSLNLSHIHAISYVVYMMIQRSLGPKVAKFQFCVNLICEQSSIKSEHFGER